MAKQRGNPNWGKPELPSAEPTISSFEALVQALGLTPDQYVHSAELREWARKNKEQKYVPLDLLESWGMKASVREI